MRIPWILLALAAACAPQRTPAPPPTPQTAEYVGRQACVGCHASEDRLWQGSHHDPAMQEATAATVLGDFGGATLTHFGVTSTSFRRNESFFIRTDGPD